MTRPTSSGEMLIYQHQRHRAPTTSDLTLSAHNPKVAGSNPAPATTKALVDGNIYQGFFPPASKLLTDLLTDCLRMVCATDGGWLHLGGGLLAESVIGSLAVESAVGSVEVVVVLPLLELVVEQLGVVDHDAVEEPVELLSVDAV